MNSGGSCDDRLGFRKILINVQRKKVRNNGKDGENKKIEKKDKVRRKKYKG